MSLSRTLDQSGSATLPVLAGPAIDAIDEGKPRAEANKCVRQHRWQRRGVAIALAGWVKVTHAAAPSATKTENKRVLHTL